MECIGNKGNATKEDLLKLINECIKKVEWK